MDDGLGGLWIYCKPCTAQLACYIFNHKVTLGVVRLRSYLGISWGSSSIISWALFMGIFQEVLHTSLLRAILWGTFNSNNKKSWLKEAINKKKFYSSDGCQTSETLPTNIGHLICNIKLQYFSCLISFFRSFQVSENL